MSTVIYHDLREERRQRRAERKQQRLEAEKPKTPLEDLMQRAAIKAEIKSQISFDTLERLDTILTATEQMALDWPADAAHIARGLLRAILRLLWVKTSGRPLSEPKPNDISAKLLQKGVYDKPTHRRVKAAMPSSNPVHILDTCRGLMVLLSR